MERDVEVLPDNPRLAPAFARSLLPRRRTSRASIPTRSAVIEGLVQDRARLAAYDRLTGFTLRDHVPPTWLHVLTFPLHIHLLSDPESSIRLIGAVHVSNRMTLRRPVSVGEVLTTDVHLDALRPHARGALVDLVGQVRVEDETVWDGSQHVPGSRGVRSRRAAGDAAPGIRTRHSPGLVEAPRRSWATLPGRVARPQPDSHQQDGGADVRLPAAHHPRHVDPREGARRASRPGCPPTTRREVAFTKPIMLPSDGGAHHPAHRVWVQRRRHRPIRARSRIS